MKYPHQILIDTHQINVNKLPKDLQQAIHLFDKKMKDYETAESESDEKEVKELKAALKKLSNEITFEILEHAKGEEMGEFEDELNVPKDKEGILRHLYENQITEVTKDQLKQYGYPVGFWHSFPIKGERVGGFEVSRNNANEKFYKIRKI